MSRVILSYALSIYQLFIFNKLKNNTLNRFIMNYKGIPSSVNQKHQQEFSQKFMSFFPKTLN